MRNRLVSLLALLAIVASACGSTSPTVESADAATEADDGAVVQLAPSDSAADDVAGNEDEADSADVVEATTTTTPESTMMRSGREAILANHSEGKPYVLWYWGSH